MSLTSRDIGGDVPEAWVDAVNARLDGQQRLLEEILRRLPAAS